MAVILGLLLVVTFIANYISTTLPSQMGQNDLQHEVTVQNQVAQLAALLQEVAKADAIDAQVSQPVTLGSTSAPPFAGQDSSTDFPRECDGRPQCQLHARRAERVCSPHGIPYHHREPALRLL